MSPDARRLVEGCREEAEGRGEALYLVGGAVRDLLRQHAPGRRLPEELREIDLAIDGDSVAVAGTVARTTGAALVLHRRFQTAMLTLAEGEVDLARTRRERYDHPGALPTVRPAPIATDLWRRDFTVNALAVVLTGAEAGTVIDPYDGQRDLRTRMIRILHDQSFHDDPTRLIRACRYAARLEGQLSLETAAAARRDRGRLRALSRNRFGAAWRELLEDPAAPAALELAVRLGLPAEWLPGWRPSPRLRRAFTVYPSAAFFWALTGLTEREEARRETLVVQCALEREEQALVKAGATLAALRRSLARPTLRAGAAASLLRPQPELALRASTLLWSGSAREWVVRFLEEWRTIRPPLSAAELEAEGVPPGRRLGAWLELLRDARIDGELPAGRSGVAAARRWVRSCAGVPPRPSRHKSGGNRSV